jgi:outer membrane cobalamin receptor
MSARLVPPALLVLVCGAVALIQPFPLLAQEPLLEGILLRASIQNLFDARYEPVQGYPAPGRTIFAELVSRR